MYYTAGVDSGGTNTKIALTDRAGTPCVLPSIDGSLSGVRSDEELRSALDGIISAIRQASSDKPVYIWISCAGYSPASRERLIELLRSATAGMRGCVAISNDATSLLLAYRPGTVVIVAGTGSEVIARSTSGRVIRVGGDEWIAADFGSAFWIGLRGIRAAYKALEGGSATGLLSALICHYGSVADTRCETEECVRIIVRALAESGSHPKRAVASFAAVVTEQAEAGDEVARSIVHEAVVELADCAARAYRQVAQDEPTARPSFVLNGGVAYRSALYAESFRAVLNELLFDVRRRGCVLDLEIIPDGSAAALTLAMPLVNEGFYDDDVRSGLCSVLTLASG